MTRQGPPPRRPVTVTLWEAQARRDYAHWHANDRKIRDRINTLVEVIETEPFSGIGKPEPLQWELARYWSRRIDKANRIVYRVERGVLTIISCRYHYTK
ncbi:MAG: Txe/YoeB family addiction module toxin [Casimicrobiaceae bacterium]